ncbi:MAG: HlyD family efflux transporter periplasmic adaptor subunit [Pirellulales bacterium]
MRWPWILSALAIVAIVSGLAAVGLVWRGDGGRLTGGSAASPSRAQHDHAPVSPERVRLSPQARANLKLVSKPLAPGTFWKVIQLPGKVVDRPGVSDRGVVSPFAGVVTKVHQFPGDIVTIGEPLFTIRLLGEAMQLAQTELLKATQEIEITEDMRQRLSATAETGGIPKIRITEIDNELRRLAVAQRAYRLELQTRGLTPHQIEEIGGGKFVTETQVLVPEQHPGGFPAKASEEYPNLFEVQELKVELGQQVQAGQMLCMLSHHQELYVEGRAFRKELPLLERSIEQSWPVEVEFMDDEPGRWPERQSQFTIRHISNTVDPASRTFAVYLPLANQCRPYESEGHAGLLWRFRPGQRVRLRVKSERLENVFVLPADAVVREGPETYAFRQDGDFFDPKPVHVLYQDRQHSVIANDGSIAPGIFVAQSGAHELNRVLKSQSAASQPRVHVHADGTAHADH